MSNTTEQLLKIAQLLQSQDRKNILLGLVLCQQQPAVYLSEWVEVLNAIGTAYLRIEKNKEMRFLTEVQEYTVDLVERLLPAFQEAEQGYQVALFFGDYLGECQLSNYLPESPLIIQLLQDLRKQLSEHDKAILNLKTGRLTNVQKGTDVLLATPWETLQKYGFVLLDVWHNVYDSYKKKPLHQANKNIPQQDWSLEWQSLLLPIVNKIKNHLEQDVLDSIPLVIYELLHTLWLDASSVGLHKDINEKLQQQIYQITTCPPFSAFQQQWILMHHYLFEFPKQHIKFMGIVQESKDINIYDTAEQEVQHYIHNLNRYFEKIAITELDEDTLHNIRVSVFDIWQFYYLPDIEPYLQLLLQFAPDDKYTCFFLGQLYYAKDKQAEAQKYFERYLLLVDRQQQPPNNYILSEINYLHRTYAPSSAEAMMWLGKIEEKKGDLGAAKQWYRTAIDKSPDYHLAPYIFLIQLLWKEAGKEAEIYQLVKQYMQVIYHQTRWRDPSPMHFGKNIQVGAHRNRWVQQYPYLFVRGDSIDREYGYQDLNLSFQFLFFHFANYFYEQAMYPKASESITLAEQCRTIFKNLSLQPTYSKEINYPLPTQAVTTAEIEKLANFIQQKR